MDGQCSEGFILLILIITSLKGRIEVQILEVTLILRLYGCCLKQKLEYSNNIHKETIWHQIRIGRSSDRRKICRIFEMKITEIFSKRTWRLMHSQWDAYHQNLDRNDKMKHLPEAWIWKTFHYCYYLLENDLVCNVYVSFLQPIKTSRHSLCSEVFRQIHLLRYVCSKNGSHFEQ